MINKDQQARDVRIRTIDRQTVRALVGRLVDDRVVQATPGEGIEDGIAALKRAANRGKGTIVRIGKNDVAVLPVRYLQLLERLIEQEEDRIDVEDAERRLNDPTEVPIPFEEALRQIGLGDV
ncbi:MAG: hypothetical protein ABI353_07425 [Isosphaeraceae bacterium]